MKIKHIALIALTALGLGLASVGGGAPAIASIRGGTTGDFREDAPAIAGGMSGGVLRGDGEVAPEPAIAGGINGGVLGSHS